jgi:hypothetical protein
MEFLCFSASFMMSVFIYSRRKCVYSATKGEIRVMRRKKIIVCLAAKSYSIL